MDFRGGALNVAGRATRLFSSLCAVWVCAVSCAGLVLGSTGRALAEDSDGNTLVYARVIVDSAAVRSGPGATYRSVYSAHRDQVFPLRGRDSRHYWFRIELPDGTQGFIQGEAVYNLEVGDEQAHGGRFLPGILAAPVLPRAHGEVALMGGALGSGGFVGLRPTWLIAPSFGIELTGAAAVARGGRLMFALLGPVVNFFPSSPVVPFCDLAGGIVTSSPNSDTFLLKAGSVSALAGGAGLRIAFRYRVTLRLEARSYVLFDADRYRRKEEYSAGLTVFF